MKPYTEFWKRYFDFKGVTTRKAFWLTTLTNVILCSVLNQITIVNLSNGVGGYAPLTLGIIYYFVIFIPTIAMTVRRLHDAKFSGFFVLLNIIPFFGNLAVLIMNIIGSRYENNKWYLNDVQKGYINNTKG